MWLQISKIYFLFLNKCVERDVEIESCLLISNLPSVDIKKALRAEAQWFS